MHRIELLTNQSPDDIFRDLLQTFEGLRGPNPYLTVDGPNPVTAVGQKLTFTLGFPLRLLQGPFSVKVKRFDTAAHTLSAVTLRGHPLAGWRYWRVFSVGPNDVIVETGTVDRPGPWPWNYAGYFLTKGLVLRTWEAYLRYIQGQLGAQQGSSVDPNLVKGNYDDTMKEYISLNVCEATSCQ